MKGAQILICVVVDFEPVSGKRWAGPSRTAPARQMVHKSTTDPKCKTNDKYWISDATQDGIALMLGSLYGAELNTNLALVRTPI